MTAWVVPTILNKGSGVAHCIGSGPQHMDNRSVVLAAPPDTPE